MIEIITIRSCLAHFNTSSSISELSLDDSEDVLSNNQQWLANDFTIKK